jgi:DNA topoisomerase-1
MEAVTLEEAITLLAEKGKDLPPKGKGGAKGRKAPAKKATSGEKVTALPEPAAKKAPAKKAPARSTAAKARPAAKKAPAKKPAAKAKR